MKILCVANFLFGNISGAQSVAKTHIDVLYSTFGNENVNVFALTGTEKVLCSKYKVRQVKSRPLVRICNLLSGNTGKINKEITDEIINNIKRNNIKFVFIDDSIYGKLVKKIKKKCDKVIVAVYYHDIKNNLCRQWIKHNPKKTPVYISLIYNEYLTQKYADYNIVLNNREANMYKKYYNKYPEVFLPVILPSQVCNIKKTSSYFKILFVGGYYYPNVNGFRWFVNNVLPIIKRKIYLHLVGNGMDKLKEEFSQFENIVVEGWIEDLRPIYADANIIIGPIFEGAGMKVKTAEALSFGKIFVGTDESLEGYKERLPENLYNHYVFNCNSAEEFAEVIDSLDSNDYYIQEVKDFFEKNYSVYAASNIIKDIIAGKYKKVN